MPLSLSKLVTPAILLTMCVAAAPSHADPRVALQVTAPADPALANPAIDMPGYLRIAGEAAEFRATRRISEPEFIRMSHEPGTVVLDARSLEKYDEMHVKGAVHLSFPDITVATLAGVIPSLDTRVLIYCNNNFENATSPFPRKMATASLNLSTFIALYTNGYRSVYELAPLIDIHATKIEFEPALVPAGEH